MVLGRKWCQEALGDSEPKSNSRVAKLEAEHRKLLEEQKKLKDLATAVQTLRSIRLPEALERGKKSKAL